MAEVKIAADSGGGSVSIKGPSTTGSNAAREFTLPDSYSANGSIVVKDSVGRIGLGMTPSTNNAYLLQLDSGTNSTFMNFGNSVDGNGPDNGFVVGCDLNEAALYQRENKRLTIYTNNTERVRIHSDGSITTNGNSSIPTGSTNGFGFTEDQFYISGDGSGDNYQIRFYNSNGLVGSCMTSGSSTSYNTSSDYRLKENVIPLTGAITRIKQLTPKRFNFKANASKTVDGFLAHEVTSIVPEAISGTKDAVEPEDNADKGIKKGDIIPQAIDQAKLVPLLTAALKEAIAKIETLETKVAALEAG